MTIKLAVVITLALGTGCLRHGQQTMHEQLRAVGSWDKARGLSAQVDRTTLATGEAVDVQTTTVDDNPLLMRGILGDELCFGQTRDYSGAFSREEADANGEGFYKRARYELRTLESLDELTAKTPWPDPPATSMLEVNRSDTQFEDTPCDAMGEHCGMGWWHVTVGFCAPVPPIPPTANYLVLFLIRGNYNRIAVWQLTGEPPPPADADPPAEDPPAEDPPAED